MKIFSLLIICVCGLNIQSHAQVVRSSQHDEIAATKKGTLSTSKSSGSGATGDLCVISIDTSSLKMTGPGTGAFCLNQQGVTLTAKYDPLTQYNVWWWRADSALASIDSGYNQLEGYEYKSVYLTNPGVYVFGNYGNCDIGIEITPTIPDKLFNPSNTIFCQGGSVELKGRSSAADVSKQWYKDNKLLPGASHYTYKATKTGNYYLQTTDANGCVLNSGKINVTVYNPPTLHISGDNCAPGFLKLDINKGNLVPDTIKWYRDEVLIKTFINKGTVVAAGKGRGHGAKQLNTPYGIFLDSSKNIYVADYGNYRVMKYAPGSTSGTRIGDTLLYYGHPTDIVKDGDDIFVSTTNSLVKISSLTENLGGFNLWGIAIGDDHSPHVTFSYSYDPFYYYNEGGSVLAFYKDGSGYYNTLSVAGDNKLGKDLTHLNYPNGIYQDENYNLFIADNYLDSLNNNIGRIVKWHILDNTGELIAGGKNYGNAPGQISFAAGVTFDKKGNMYVSDPVNKRVQLWKPGATHGITLVSGFKPWGIKVDDNLNLYVADQTNNRVLKFSSLFYNKITADVPGTYKAVVTYPGGCVVTSGLFTVGNCAAFAEDDAKINSNETKWVLNINPNPVQTKLNVHLANIYGATSVAVIDMMGRILATQQITASGNNDLDFNTGTLSSGIYFIQVMHNGKKMHLQFVKE
jgi:hypothetical protein